MTGRNCIWICHAISRYKIRNLSCGTLRCTKPLFVPMIACYQWTLTNKMQRNVNQNWKLYLQRIHFHMSSVQNVGQCGKSRDSFGFWCCYTKPNSQYIYIFRACGVLFLSMSGWLCPPVCPYELACPCENLGIIHSVQTPSMVDPQWNMSY